MVEHSTADREVLGSNPGVPCILITNDFFSSTTQFTNSMHSINVASHITVQNETKLFTYLRESEGS